MTQRDHIYISRESEPILGKCRPAYYLQLVQNGDHVMFWTYPC